MPSRVPPVVGIEVGIDLGGTTSLGAVIEPTVASARGSGSAPTTLWTAPCRSPLVDGRSRPPSRQHRRAQPYGALPRSASSRRPARNATPLAEGFSSLPVLATDLGPKVLTGVTDPDGTMRSLCMHLIDPEPTSATDHRPLMHSPVPPVVAVDLGGTKVLTRVIDPDGTVHSLCTHLIDREPTSRLPQTTAR